MAVTLRYPFAVDAYAHGFTVGFREDCSFQSSDVPNVDLPADFLDNEFRNPDLDRYRTRFEQVEPDVAVVGDGYTWSEAIDIQATIDELREDYPETTYIAVPKCNAAFDVFADEVVLGYPAGYSDASPDDYSQLGDWRGRPVHVLGGSPVDQAAVIDQVTQPTLTDLPPSDVRGVDGNGCFKAALYGEYWTPDGYEPADHLTLRDTMRRSLHEIQGYWQDRDVWPEKTPRDRYGPAVIEPDDPVYAADGGDIRTQEDLEYAYVTEYTDDTTRAYRSETAQRFVEYREGLTAADAGADRRI